MATVNKDFRVKNGLIVEGSTGTINESDIITAAKITGGTQTGITVEYNAGLVDFTVDTVSSEDVEDIIGSILGTGLEYTDNAGDPGSIDIDRTAVDTWYDPAGAAASAQSAAESYADGLAVNYDPAGSAASAQAAAESYADGLAVNYDPAGAAASAQAAAESYADGLAVNYDPAGSAATAQANAESYADGLAVNYEVAGAVSTHAGLTSTHGVTGDIVGTTDSQTLTNKTMGDDLLMDGFQISGLGSPDQADHAATKAYVDAAVEGLHVHESVRVAVNGNISIATGLENGDSAGGVTLATGNRVLLKDQTTTSENGIYVVQESGPALRATDFDTAMEIDSGDFVFVSEGTYANTGWVQTLKPATIGTDPINFTQFSGAGTFLAGNGLLLDGNTFEIDDTITADLSGVQTLTNKTIDGSENTLSNIPNSALDNDSITINGTATALGGSITLGTDDVAEGTTNLYFTDARAVTAIENVVPNFSEIDINQVLRQAAGVSTLTTAEVTETVFAFDHAEYRSAKFLVKMASGSHTEVLEILLTLDTSNNIAITEYAIVGTNGSLGVVDATIGGTGSSQVLLTVNPTNANTTVNVFGTLLV